MVSLRFLQPPFDDFVDGAITDPEVSGDPEVHEPSATA